MKPLTTATFLIIALALAGCSTYQLDDNGQRRLTGANSVPVFLSLKDSMRVEAVKGFLSGSNKVETGQVWKHAFIGGNNAPAMLDITSTEMRQSLSGGGFTMRYTYTADVRFHYKGQVHILKGKGTRAAAMHLESAMRQAVELAVVDIADQVKALMTDSRL